MKKLYSFSKICGFVLAFLNAIFCAVMAFAPGERTASLLAIIIIVFGALNLGRIYLSRDFFKGSKLHSTILMGVIFILGIVFLAAGTPIDSICIAWAIVDLILCLINIIVHSIELKKHKIALIELIVQALNVVIDILLLIELHHGLTLHLAFCSFEILVSTGIGIYEFIEQKKHFSSPMLSANKDLK